SVPVAAEPMAWWGWGSPEHRRELPAAALRTLGEQLGARADAVAPVALAGVALPESALGATARQALVAAVGAEHVRCDREARVVHAAGKNYPDLVRMRAGAPAGAPDAVVLPGSHAEVRAVLDACGEHGVAVVPFGGGTSVVGGVAPDRG